MILQSTSFRCLACKNEWMDDLVYNAHFRVVIASMQAVRCPLCHAGWKRIAIITEPSRDDTAG
jgi:hypothetical protein